MLSMYPACFYKEAEGYSVVFPDLNNLATQGDTFEEAMEMAVDCLAGALLFLFELTAPLAFVLVWFYNGQRGACSPLQKKAFYWFYPVHLSVLAAVTNLLL